MGPSGLCFELIYHDDIVYEGWIGSKFILVHKGVLAIQQGCAKDNEQVLWFVLIDYLDDLMWLINQLRLVLGQIK